jgi:dihydropteroate synthase
MYQFCSGNIQIMGILNVTPDSFFDGDAYFSPELAGERALELEAQGADIIDIGAQSTRPGSVPVPPEEELNRLMPVLEKIIGQIKIPVSIDTYYPEVAEQALAHGAAIINDVSGKFNPKMAEVIARYYAGWILMHNNGGADAVPAYEPDVVTAVKKSLIEMTELAMNFGIAREQLCVDPGIGFGKSREDNLRLIANICELKMDNIALLAGVSRKRVIGEEYAPHDRLAGTIAAHVMAQMGGADILRVHDVKDTRQATQFVKNAIDFTAKKR